MPHRTAYGRGSAPGQRGFRRGRYVADTQPRGRGYISAAQAAGARRRGRQRVRGKCGQGRSTGPGLKPSKSTPPDSGQSGASHQPRSGSLTPCVSLQGRTPSRRALTYLSRPQRTEPKRPREGPRPVQGGAPLNAGARRICSGSRAQRGGPWRLLLGFPRAARLADALLSLRWNNGSQPAACSMRWCARVRWTAMRAASSPRRPPVWPSRSRWMCWSRDSGGCPAHWATRSASG